MIGSKDVQHIANLARIELDDSEKAKFEKELSAILEFVEKLNEVDTQKVESMTGGTRLKNVLRKDCVVDESLEEESAELLNAAPDKKEGWIRVKAVFE